ncbi:hypothetical protein DL93DRAFT_971656 [Clavulina sp. PMI_390]|nr:hypothetical protein DL93DRAFT_971656 [Clavulina sp. PMI_390]
MSIDPSIVKNFLDARDALMANVRQVARPPHILSVAPSERAHLRTSVKKIGTELNTLASDLESVQGDIQRLLAGEVLQARAQVQDSLSPITILPSEIFLRIIRMASSSPERLHNFLGVCKAWRALVTTEPRLFTEILWDRWDPKLIALWRSRAKGLCHTVSIGGLLSNEERWRSVFPPGTTMTLSTKSRGIRDELRETLPSCGDLFINDFVDLNSFQTWLDSESLVLSHLCRIKFGQGFHSRLSQFDVSVTRLPILQSLHIDNPQMLVAIRGSPPPLVHLCMRVGHVIPCHHMLLCSNHSQL